MDFIRAPVFLRIAGPPPRSVVDSVCQDARSCESLERGLVRDEIPLPTAHDHRSGDDAEHDAQTEEEGVRPHFVDSFGEEKETTA
jgi:hypothetical protein